MAHIAHSCLLILAALGIALRLSTADDINYSFGSTKVSFLGQSPNFRIYPDTNSTTYLQLKFSKFEERDVDDKKVNGHTIESLASANPVWVASNESTSGGTTYTYVSMYVNPTSGNSNSWSSSCPTNGNGNGRRLLHEDSKAASRRLLAGTPYVKIFVLFGFNNSVTFPYGLNKATSVDKGGLKFTVEYGNWPFCADSNTLYMEIQLLLKGDAAAQVNTSTASDGSTQLKIPLGNDTTSTLTFANYAYEAQNGTRSLPVKVAASSSGSNSQVTLRLPNPTPDTKVYYDPTVTTTHGDAAASVRLTLWTTAAAVLLSALLLL